MYHVQVLNSDGDQIDHASDFATEQQAEQWFDDNYPVWMPGIHKMEIWQDDQAEEETT